MNRKLSGQITIEVAIVFPLIMMMVASLVYASFYVHDVITIKSLTYSVGVQSVQENGEMTKELEKKSQRLPLFVLGTTTSCKNKLFRYEIETQSGSRRHIGFLQKIMGFDKSLQKIKIEKRMSKEILYGCRAVCDQVKKSKK